MKKLLRHITFLTSFIVAVNTIAINLVCLEMSQGCSSSGELTVDDCSMNHHNEEKSQSKDAQSEVCDCPSIVMTGSSQIFLANLETLKYTKKVIVATEIISIQETSNKVAINKLRQSNSSSNWRSVRQKYSISLLKQSLLI